MYSPSPDIIPKILDDLCDPDLTLREIAGRAHTTVEALSVWMATPDIAARIELIQSTIAQRTRLVATCFLPAAVRTVNRVLEAYEHEEDHVPINPGSLVGHEYRRRSRESARRAASLLLRLARFTHPPCHRHGRTSGHACADGGAKADPPLPDLVSERASRVSGRASSLDNLLAEVAAVAPRLSALSGVAGAAAPAPAPSSGDHASRTADDPQPAEVPIPHLDLGATAPPVIHVNGRAHPANHEHWP